MQIFHFVNHNQSINSGNSVGVRQKAKAAYIHTRIVSELESRRYEDPMLFKKFSERIRDTIAEYRKSRDENIYLAKEGMVICI